MKKPQKTANVVNRERMLITPFDDWDELSMIPFDRPIPEWLRLPTDDPDWMPEHWKSHNSKKTTE